MSIELSIHKRTGRIVSPVRCITSVYPLQDPAMGLVFSFAPSDDHDMRMTVLDCLKAAGATASFVITGSIAESDAEFCQSAVDAGFELISGGFTGRPFSTRGLKAPSSVLQLNGYDAVLMDLTKLHDIVKEDFGYTMKAGMPPYGVTYIDNGISIYDLYDLADYQYIKGSLILAEGEEGRIAQSLAQDKNSLNGQIAVMSLCSVDTLQKQIDALADAGYGLCSVSDLLSVSPFSDIGPDDPAFAPAKKLVESGRPIAMRNNKIMTKPFETMGDTLTTLLPKEARTEKLTFVRNHKTMMGKYSIYNPYCGVIYWIRNKAMRVKHDFPTTSGLLSRSLYEVGLHVDPGKYRVQYRRSEIIRMFCDILCATEDQDPYGVFDEYVDPVVKELHDAIGDEEFAKLEVEVKEHRAKMEAEKAAKEAKKNKGGEEKKEIETNKDQIVL